MTALIAAMDEAMTDEAPEAAARVTRAGGGRARTIASQ